MPEEVKSSQTAPVNTPAAGAPAAKKSNACTIIIVIVLALLVLGGVGGYLGYRYVKNKVKNVVDNSSVSTSSGNTTTTTATSSDQEVKNNYGNTNAVTATSVQGKTYSTEIAGILSPIFGGAKLSEWMDLNGSDAMTFLVPRKITASDFAAIEAGFIAKGYSKNANYTTSDEMSIYFDNANIEILVGCTVGESTVRSTVAQKTQ